MKIKLSRAKWEEMGRKAGWIKTAKEIDEDDSTVIEFPKKQLSKYGPSKRDPNDVFEYFVETGGFRVTQLGNKFAITYADRVLTQFDDKWVATHVKNKINTLKSVDKVKDYMSRLKQQGMEDKLLGDLKNLGRWD